MRLFVIMLLNAIWFVPLAFLVQFGVSHVFGGPSLSFPMAYGATWYLFLIKRLV